MIIMPRLARRRTGSLPVRVCVASNLLVKPQAQTLKSKEVKATIMMPVSRAASALLRGTGMI